jgi:ATP-binding cassette subfamily F protein uup
MNYLSAENISKSFTEKELFSNLSFGINKGDKVAMIAGNGAGKTTLLKVLAGKEFPDSGKVVMRNGIKVGFLEQDPDFNQAVSINQFIERSHSEVFTIIRDYKKALEAQSENYTDETHAIFETASTRMDQYHAWDYERKITELLTRFSITDLEQTIDTLSGGQKKRLALALTLLDSPDVLLLDEPTNHLDIEMIEWLEKYLTQSNMTLLVVTHDRYFLDQVCNRIMEMESGKLFFYHGNYSYFLEKRAEREEVEKAGINKARQLMKKELEWLRRMPKARTTKSKARIDSFDEIRDKATGKKIQQNINLEIKMTRVGGKILEVEKVSKSYGDLKILEHFEYIFKKGERIGIIGKNGAGKTSFLNILTGKERADSGKVTRGETTVFGFYTQEGLKVNENKKVIDVVKDIAEVIITGNGSTLTASQFLHHFLFTAELQHTLVSKLSGGEKRRLLLLTVLIRNPNFLIMDEPTNDLDIATLNKLEDFLTDFGGCLILVSHDRYFLDKLVDHLFIFEGNGVIRDFYGTYSEYKLSNEILLKQQNRLSVPKSKSVKGDKDKSVIREKTKLTFKEKLEMEQLEKEINVLENEKSNLERTIISGDKNYEELETISHRISDTIKEIEIKTNRWMELASFTDS